MNICPIPTRWNAIYESLLKACTSQATASKPPVPLILNSWWSMNDVEKVERWEETKTWAEENGFSELLTVAPEEWYSVDEPSTYDIGPLGGPMYLPWRFEPSPIPSPDQVETVFIKLTENWEKIAGELSQYTRPSRITGKKRRRLVVVRVPSAPSPRWGDWNKLAVGHSRRRFTEFRRAVNEAIAPFEIDHIDFEVESNGPVGKPQGHRKDTRRLHNL